MKRPALVAVAVFLLSAFVPAVPAGAGGFCQGYVGGEKFTDAPGTTVLMEENCFTPTILRVDRGAMVTFVNQDFEQHSVGGAVGTFGEIHRGIRPGKSVAFTFRADGVYPYVCLFHPGMAGAIVVGDGIGKSAQSKAITPAVSKLNSGGGSDSGGSAVAPVVPASDESSWPVLALTLGLVGVLLVAALTRFFTRRTATPAATSEVL